MAEHDNGQCRQHSGVCIELDHLKASDRDQWQEINNMKKLLTTTLIATIFTLLGVIINLALWTTNLKP